MDLPPELINQHIMVSGGAFRSMIEKGGKYRYHFVLNQNPKNDKAILLVTATTKIAKYKSKYSQDVLVEISPAEYKPLEQSSLINCELARVLLKTKLLKSITKGKFEILERLPEVILKKLHNALAECRNVPPIDKKLALGEENV